MKKISFFVVISIIFATSCKDKQEKMKTEIQPPIAKIVPHTLEKHGDIRTDNYFWLNQREDKEVIDYLTMKL